MPDPSKPFDLILMVQTPGPIQIGHELLEQVGSILRSRLSCNAIVVPENNLNPLDTLRDNLAVGEPNRVAIIPCGFESILLSQIRSAWWFGRLPKSNQIFLADPWTPKDFGRWIGNRAASLQVHLDRDPRTDAVRTQEAIETLVLVAFWANRIAPNAIMLVDSIEVGDQDPPSVLSEAHLDPDEIATWLIQNYLRSVRSRPIPWSEQSDAQWPCLSRLHYELGQQLPSEYSQRLDEVSPRSMGSAKIAPDDSGLVPWDKIWTSFCDLAMAGGPPHRGRLLEPVNVQDIERSQESYQAVVAEIRRGIGLASGLRTCDSPYPGWICVECDSESMAAWLMRAILVENISVRRESTKLYLPAGPDFRIDKEIKNVITAVAKTNHYWQAHLRSRQPPNPL